MCSNNNNNGYLRYERANVSEQTTTKHKIHRSYGMDKTCSSETREY